MNPKTDGILRCMLCGHEQDRVPAGLNYGFPLHCNQKMIVVTPLALQQEREFAETLEAEARFDESIAS